MLICKLKVVNCFIRYDFCPAVCVCLRYLIVQFSHKYQHCNMTMMYIPVILLPAHPASFAHKFLLQRVPASPGMQ